MFPVWFGLYVGLSAYLYHNNVNTLGPQHITTHTIQTKLILLVYYPRGVASNAYYWMKIKSFSHFEFYEVINTYVNQVLALH